MNINRTIAISTIVQGYPETMNVFSKFGVQIGGEEENMDKTLEELCLEHALDFEEVVTELYKTTD